jgi:hypothetical protein
MEHGKWIGWLLCLPPVAQALIRQVPQDIATIQAAIDLSLADGDTVLLAQGVYNERFSIGSGSVVLCSHYIFTGDTLDIEQTVLDGQYQGTVITVDMEDADRLELNGLTLRGGLGEYDIDIDDVRGGGMDILRAGSVYFRNMVFRDNHSSASGSAVWYLRPWDIQDRAWFYLENVNAIDNRDPGPNVLGVDYAITIVDCTALYAKRLFVKGEIGPGSMQYFFNARDSVIVHNAEFTGIHHATSCPFGASVDTYGYAEIRGIRYHGNHSFRSGSVWVSGYTNSRTVVRDVRIENNVYEDHYREVTELGPMFAVGGRPDVFVDVDSVFILNNRVENTGCLMEARGRGELRNVFIIGNRVGSRLSQTPGYNPPKLVKLRDVDLYNFVMQYDTLETRYLGHGQYVSGWTMVDHLVFHPDSARIRKLDISHNLYIDNDEYLDADIHSESNNPWPNLGRAYWFEGFHAYPGMAHALFDSCRFVANYQPNHLPEVDNDGSYPNGYLGYTAILRGSADVDEYIRHTQIRNLIIDDVDDGGIMILHPGAHVEIENAMVTNSRRLGMLVAHGQPQNGSITMRNILLQNIIQQDFYRAWPFQDSLVEQSAFYFDGSSSVNATFSNFTITGCDMPVLLSARGNTTTYPTTFRNSIISGNTYDFFQYLQPWPRFENCIVQRPVPGINNLIGVDPGFDPVLGPPWLAPDSPAIDAGDPDSVYNDPEDPANPGFALWPSQGSLINDIGYTGGPAAAAMDYLVLLNPPQQKPRPARPETFTLHPAHPNPFNPSTTVSYTLARPLQVELSVYNLLGQQVRTLAFGLQDAGEHRVPFTAGELSSGLYVVELKAGDHSQTQKVLLLK